MMDDETQASALRERLDRELAGVQATAAARERLNSRIAERSGAGHDIRREPRGLRSLILVPAAAALIVIAVIAVPTLLRSGSTVTPVQPGGAPTPPVSSGFPTPSASSAAPTPTSTPQPTATIAPSASPSAVGPSAAGLSIAARPSIALPGQRVAITLIGVPAVHGDIVVSWGDTNSDTLPGSCGRQQAAPSQVAHSYPRVGRYRVTVNLDTCGGKDSAGLTVTVQASKASAVASARASGG
jgi:hypothetical protein